MIRVIVCDHHTCHIKNSVAFAEVVSEEAVAWVDDQPNVGLEFGCLVIVAIHRWDSVEEVPAALRRSHRRCVGVPTLENAQSPPRARPLALLIQAAVDPILVLLYHCVVVVRSLLRPVATVRAREARVVHCELSGGTPLVCPQYD